VYDLASMNGIAPPVTWGSHAVPLAIASCIASIRRSSTRSEVMFCRCKPQRLGLGLRRGDLLLRLDLDPVEIPARLERHLLGGLLVLDSPG